MRCTKAAEEQLANHVLPKRLAVDRLACIHFVKVWTMQPVGQLQHPEHGEETPLQVPSFVLLLHAVRGARRARSKSRGRTNSDKPGEVLVEATVQRNGPSAATSQPQDTIRVRFEVSGAVYAVEEGAGGRGRGMNKVSCEICIRRQIRVRMKRLGDTRYRTTRFSAFLAGCKDRDERERRACSV
jgi:hypothetical protein